MGKVVYYRSLEDGTEKHYNEIKYISYCHEQKKWKFELKAEEKKKAEKHNK